MFCPVLYRYAVSLIAHLSNESATLNGGFIEELEELASSWATGPHAPLSLIRKRVVFCCARIEPLLDMTTPAVQDDLADIDMNWVDGRLAKEAEDLHVDRTEYQLTSSGVGAEQLRELRLQERSSLLVSAEALFVAAQDFMRGRAQTAGRVGDLVLAMLVATKMSANGLLGFLHQLEGVRLNGTV